MVKHCCVDICRNRLGVCANQFFRVPRVVQRLKAEKKEVLIARRATWLSRVFGSEYKDSDGELHVCSDHFVSGHPSEPFDQGSIDWAPSLKLGHYRPTPMQRELPGADSGEARNEHPPGAIENAPKPSEKVVNSDAQVGECVQGVGNVCDSSVQAENSDEVYRSDTEDVNEEVFFDATSDVHSNVSISTQTVKYWRDCGTQMQKGKFASSVHVQTDLSMRDIDKLESNLIEATRKLNVLQVSEDTYRDSEITRYYTGLPNFEVLIIIFKLVSPYLKSSPRNSLSTFQQFALTLMKLRLNLYTQDLAYRFGVSRSTVSRTFQTCIEVMYWRLKRNVFWPERPLIQSTMPQCFKESFGNTITVIIDCFEVVLEKPSNLKAKAQTWSNYKHNQTLKFLIAITPQGFISFISKAFGGRCTDKFITETSGFLENLIPGDVVMADRGFLIEDSVGFHMAKVVMPAFTKGLQQLSPTDVENTRQIANVRIHVERVISNLRQKYRIMSNRVPISLANTGTGISMDEIAAVCCSLINFCGSVVPLD